MTLDDVLAGYTITDPDGLKAALLVREENMADLIRLAGTQFGLFPEIVAKVLNDVGLGPAPSAEEVEMVNQAFAQRMEWWREQIRLQGGDQ